VTPPAPAPPAPSSEVPELELVDLQKRFGATVAVDHVAFRVAAGEFLSLLGPSGCGKTTTLRMIAGFVEPDGGRILHRGRDITGLPPYRRDVGLVFQSYALFPHLTVADNVGFGLRMRRTARAVTRERVQWALELVRLTGLEARRPHELSGGQQQRVAVARVLAAGASLLLFDEPFSNLDAKLRKDMQLELRDLQQRLGLAAVHVTHDQEEAMTMSDRLVIMHAGRMEQTGPPAEVYRTPRSAFVAEFMGRCNRLTGRLTVRDRERGLARVALGAGVEVEVPWTAGDDAGAAVTVFVRPEHVELAAAERPPSTPPGLAGVVRRIVYLGPVSLVTVDLGDGAELLVEVRNPPAGPPPLAAGTSVAVRIPPDAVRSVPA
jgi:ABC-type Fe3+/spermidine/putrescine transport system ATPase subunit